MRSARLERGFHRLKLAPSNPGATRMATRRLLIELLTVFIWLNAGDVSTQRPVLDWWLDPLQDHARRVTDLHARSSWGRDADPLRHARGELAIDQVEQRHHSLADDGTLHPAELEARRIDHVLLLERCHAVVEQPAPG